MEKDVSVLIPSYNSRDLLIPCLDRLNAQTFPRDRFEVIVVLDGSTDGSQEALAAMDTRFELKVIRQENRGRAAALNHGARFAEGRLLVIIDSDILTGPDFLRQHHDAHGFGDVVIGPIPLADRSPVNFMTDRVREWADAHSVQLARNPRITSCSQVFGANLSIPRETFQRLGGYRDGLRRTEDFHFGKKILQAGLEIYFCAAAPAAQVYDKSFRDWCGDMYQDGRSHVLLLREFPEEKPSLRASRYFPETRTKRFLRASIRRGDPLGRAFLLGGQTALEWARRAGWRWRGWSSLQGVIGDAFYWKGVYDALGGGPDFQRFIHSN